LEGYIFTKEPANEGTTREPANEGTTREPSPTSSSSSSTSHNNNNNNVYTTPAPKSSFPRSVSAQFPLVHSADFPTTPPPPLPHHQASSSKTLPLPIPGPSSGVPSAVSAKYYTSNYGSPITKPRSFSHLRPGESFSIGLLSSSPSNSSGNNYNPPSPRSQALFKKLIRTNAYTLLDDVLSRGCASLDLFAAFCKGSFCEEVLHCYFAILEFQNPIKTSEEELEQCARGIYEEYIQKNATHEVNLNQEIGEEICLQIQDENWHRHMFDSLLYELAQLLANQLASLRISRGSDLLKALQTDGILIV